MFAKIFRNVSKESILRQKILDGFTEKKRGSAEPLNSKYKPN